eukprot:3173178-Amphidinium_carterae.1
MMLAIAIFETISKDEIASNCTVPFMLSCLQQRLTPWAHSLRSKEAKLGTFFALYMCACPKRKTRRLGVPIPRNACTEPPSVYCLFRCLCLQKSDASNLPELLSCLSLPVAQ